jgi:hypothetical protein
MIDIVAHVEVEDIVKISIKEFYLHLDFYQFESVCRLLFKSDWDTIKDCVGLAISEIDDPYLAPVVQEAINNEENLELKKDLERVVKSLKKIMENPEVLINGKN